MTSIQRHHFFYSNINFVHISLYTYIKSKKNRPRILGRLNKTLLTSYCTISFVIIHFWKRAVDIFDPCSGLKTISIFPADSPSDSKHST